MALQPVCVGSALSHASLIRALPLSTDHSLIASPYTHKARLQSFLVVCLVLDGVKQQPHLVAGSCQCSFLVSLVLVCLRLMRNAGLGSPYLQIG